MQQDAMVPSFRVAAPAHGPSLAVGHRLHGVEVAVAGRGLGFPGAIAVAEDHAGAPTFLRATDRIRKVYAVAHALETELGRRPNAAEIAAELEMDVEKVELALKASRRSISSPTSPWRRRPSTTIWLPSRPSPHGYIAWHRDSFRSKTRPRVCPS